MNDARDDPRPWERLRELLALDDGDALREHLLALSSPEVARAVTHLEADERAALLNLLEPTDAAVVIEDVPESEAMDLLGEMAPADAAAIVDELRSDVQVDLLTGLDAADSEAILEEMDSEEAADVRQRFDYEPDTAGGLMVTEFLAFGSHLAVRDVVDDLRRHGETYSDYNVQYAYVADGAGRLLGVLPMRSLLLAGPALSLDRVMIAEPLRVGVPVVDGDDRLVGVVHRRDVQEAQEHQVDLTYLASSGIVGGEEFRSMSVWTRARRRLSWLSVNILLNVAAASVIALYQDTLAAVIALAVFLPIISDMSGCSGSQAVAVSIRELSLGLVKPNEIFRVLFGELRVGLLNGVVLGALLGGVAILWKGNPWLGLVVGAALALNTLVAVTIGGLVPLALRRAGKDPALASGPILTTVTDMCGFFLVLSFASFALSRLT